MPLNTMLKEKRKELALTQEQVAEYLGVSTPAVNKWEKGATCPDITLLPALARLLKTDLNTLLCFQEEMSQKEIGLFLNHVTEIFRSEGLEAAFAAAMKKVREYPANAELLHALAMVLQGSLMMAGLPFSIEERRGYEAQITKLYEAVAQSQHPQYADQARYMLASRLMADEDNARAQEVLDALPEYNPLDKRSLQAQLWLKEGKHDEAATLLEHKLLANLQEVQTTLSLLAKLTACEGDRQSAIKLAVCGQKMAELFGLWNYGSFVVPLEVAVALRDVGESVSILKKMLAAMLIPWDSSQSPICGHIQQKAGEGNLGEAFLPPVLSELEHSPEYEFLWAEPAFQALLKQYRMAY